jgi:hypothetical protein
LIDTVRGLQEEWGKFADEIDGAGGRKKPRVANLAEARNVERG